ncbi:MAG: hypothetical protein ACAF41_23745 [Leptolyngbya sp. BL-A-14]
MNGPHDMGGMHNLGPIPIAENEPVFHSEWEAKRLFEKGEGCDKLRQPSHHESDHREINHGFSGFWK